MDPTEVNWDDVSNGLRLYRETYHSVPKPDGVPSVVVRGLGGGNLSPARKLTWILGKRHFGPNWELSHKYEGEVLNLRQVDFDPPAAKDVEWWQLHVRGFPHDDGLELLAHWEPEPSEHGNAHLSGDYLDWERGTSMLLALLDDAGLPYDAPDGDGIEPVSLSGTADEALAPTSTQVEADHIVPDDDLESISGIGPVRAAALRASGFETIADLRRASPSDLLAVSGIGPVLAGQIKSVVGSEPPPEDDETDETDDSAPDSPEITDGPRTVSEFLGALEDARPGDEITVPSDADLDSLDEHCPVHIPRGVSAVSDRPAGEGALMPCDTHPSRYLVLEDGAELRGFRIIGPGDGLGKWTGDYHTSPTSTGVETVGDATIEDCEIGHWPSSGVGVGVKGGDRFEAASSWARIRNCDIHHTQLSNKSGGGLGYGVQVRRGYASIERCAFDRYRHATANTRVGESVSYRLVDCYLGAHAVGHLVDMHGDDSNPPVTGRRHIIRNCTFDSPDHSGIRQRGEDIEGLEISRNHFPHVEGPPKTANDPGCAPWQQVNNQRPNDFVRVYPDGNHFGPDCPDDVGCPADVRDRLLALLD